jgi:hypothetical protein
METSRTRTRAEGRENANLQQRVIDYRAKIDAECDLITSKAKTATSTAEKSIKVIKSHTKAIEEEVGKHGAVFKKEIEDLSKKNTALENEVEDLKKKNATLEIEISNRAPAVDVQKLQEDLTNLGLSLSLHFQKATQDFANEFANNLGRKSNGMCDDASASSY